MRRLLASAFVRYYALDVVSASGHLAQRETVSAALDLSLLRARLENRFGGAILPVPGTAPAREGAGFRTGIAGIDALLPGGVPRRALTLWTGEATSGRTAAVRALVRSACRTARVALVDATATLDAAAWCGEDGRSAAGLWVARPPSGEQAGEGAWVAEALLRAGAFALVVLDGPPPEPVEAHRLRALARETDAALLVSAEGDGSWKADVRLEFRRTGRGAGLVAGGRFRRPAAVNAGRGAGLRAPEREVELVHEPEDRLHPDPTPDRRPRARG